MKTQNAIDWAGGTQDALAKKLGISQPAVSQWGEYPPPEHQLRIQLMSAGHLVAEPNVLRPETASS